VPIHDWTRVDAGTFHDFHHTWTTSLKRALNEGVLPRDYYAQAERRTEGYEPDVVTLHLPVTDGNGSAGGTDTAVLTAPKVAPTAELDLAYYRRKQNRIAVRESDTDRVVAVIEIVSPGNKASRNPFLAFVKKSVELLDRGIHLLILDLLPPGPYDPGGIHDAIWEAETDESPVAHPDKPLTLASYDALPGLRAFVTRVAVGDELPAVQLFLQPGRGVDVPLEATYRDAFAGVPRRWRAVLEPGA
jgi:hypothetical protein